MIKVKAERTNCFTDIKKIIDITVRKLYHAYHLDSWWIEIVDGAVTGYESMSADREKSIKRTSEKGWWACAGTKSSWDGLFVPAESMRKIWMELKTTSYRWISMEDDKVCSPCKYMHNKILTDKEMMESYPPSLHRVENEEHTCRCVLVEM